MEIFRPSGATVAIDEDEFRSMVERGDTVRELKRFLAGQVGYSRFQQRLCDRSDELPDDMPVRPLSRANLFIVGHCEPDEEMDRRLYRACEHGHLGEVEKLLQ